MIYSEAFDALPADTRARIYRGLYEVLSGQNQAKDFERLTADDRLAILEILRDTKTGLPDYWQFQPATTASLR